MRLRWKIAQAMELRWWKNYLKRKPVGDYLALKKLYWDRVLNQLSVEVRKHAIILDAGCGPAGIFMVLDNQQVVAVDPLINEYESTLPHFDRAIYPNVHFFNNPLEAFEPEQKYDYIFCLNAINHVANIHKSLDNLFSWLAPGGKLILSTDAHKHSWLKPVFKVLPGDILHPHQYDLQEYRDMLLQRGAKIEKEVCLKKGNIFDYWIWVMEKTNHP